MHDSYFLNNSFSFSWDFCDFQILKDITIRSKVIQGQRVHYVPGWDCHGLPIELKALTESKTDITNLTPLQIRWQGEFVENIS